ncbi:hypothetical protein GCM10010530_09170 [Kribbella aluminosa]
MSAGLLLIGGYVGLTHRDAVLALAVSPGRLLLVTIAVVLLGVGWIWVVVASHKLIRPPLRTSTPPAPTTRQPAGEPAAGHPSPTRNLRRNIGNQYKPYGSEVPL